MKTSEIKQSRFELRLSREERLYFEKASQIAGYKTLSSFVVSAVREFASKIIREKERILTSQKDKEIFFNAILSDVEPNEKLKKAARKYLKTQSAK